MNKKSQKHKQLKKKQKPESVKSEKLEEKETKQEAETLEQIIEPEQPEEFIETEQRISRPISLTLSSGQTSQPQLWQEIPIENLEQSIKDAPAIREPAEQEEIYKPNIAQQEKFYDFETGDETQESGRELIHSGLVAPSGAVEMPETMHHHNLRNIDMRRAAEMQQVNDIREPEHLYSTKQDPEKQKERKLSPFGESAEETVRKYK